MPRMALVSLLSSGAEQKLSNSFAMFLSWLSKSLLTSSTLHVVVARDKLTALKTVSYPDKCLALCVANTYLRIPSRSEQNDNLAAMKRKYHWVIFWRHSVVTQATFLKTPLFLFSGHRHSFCAFFVFRILVPSSVVFLQSRNIITTN
jgi:hypothetical protein